MRHRHRLTAMISATPGVATVGMGFGVAGAILVTRFARAMLFEVSPTDPLTFTTVCAIIVVVAALASCIPARRAASVDPAIALRAD